MRRSTWTRWQRGLAAAIALAALPEFGSGSDPGWWVPNDASLTGPEYVRIGVPEPGEWSAQERARAIDVLSRVDRNALPRFGSEKSGEIFASLLGGEAQSRADGPSETAEGLFGPLGSARSLYRPKETDGLFFDRELVEFAAAGATIALEKYESHRRLAERIEHDVVPSGAPDVGERLLRDVGVLMEADRRLLGEHVVILVTLAEAAPLTSETGVALARHIREIVPRAAQPLPLSVRASIAATLAGVSRLPANATISATLLDVGEEVSRLSERP